MGGTTVGAPFDRAMFSVPAGDAEARSVFALAVLVAPRIALFQVAKFPRPTRIALAGLRDAVSVVAAVQIAQF